MIHSLASTDYTMDHLLPEKYRELHESGDIHIHDLDYYACKTRTCVQYDMKSLFEGGFWTVHSDFIDEPQRIQSYADLAAIIFQTQQNLDHGGQAAPAFDFFMAPGVLKSFNAHLVDYLNKFIHADIKDKKLVDTIAYTKFDIARIARSIGTTPVEIADYFKHAYNDTVRDTEQAMQGFLHNMNMMHSRGGNQVVFSSINYGTDTSPEGRLVMEKLLKVTEDGIGTHGKTAIFPIQIFKIKSGVTFSYKDYDTWRALKVDGEEVNEVWEAPNFDLFIRSMEVSSKRLFPNFMNLDVDFNSHELWRAEDPMRWMYEPATMGCRTRVFENVNGEKTSVGRGNLSFTTINLPRLAIKASSENKTLDEFIEDVKTLTVTVCEQLHARLAWQMTADESQFPFTLANNVWNQEGYEDYADSLRSGTLGVGFIGLHNAMMALFDQGHSEDPVVYNFAIKVIEAMNEVVDYYKDKYKLNYSVLATPAEGISGRFTKIDQDKFGIVPGVNDKEYYINSFHIDVTRPISAFKKIGLEAPFHRLTKGGHITYVELDGEAKKNIVAFADIVVHTIKNDAGYVSVNHPVDQCKSCGHHAIIDGDCPICGSDLISRIRRITGYLVGDLDNWNSYKQAEERDRVKHSLIFE